MRVLIIVVLMIAAPLGAQDRPAGQGAIAVAANPLAELKDEVQRVLAQANLSFTEEQERGIILMMEDRRQASEDLFGSLMDFTAGPTQGQQNDRLRSAIEWMRGEFLARLQDYLSPEQIAAWSRYRETAALAATASANEAPAGQRPQQAQTQYVRINNNAFTAEDGPYRFGQNGRGQPAPQVVDRGGAGAFHGNAQFLFKDESLNARNPFAQNKPPYQERQADFDISGPIIPGRLTTSFAYGHSEAENVDTIHATLPNEIFSLGITRPRADNEYTSRNTFQLKDGHTLSLNFGYITTSRKNENVGGFSMPERASATTGNDWNVEFVQFSNLSARSILENRLNITTSKSETVPFSSALRVNVLDAFSSGGAQNRADSTGRDYDFTNLFTRLGEVVTMRAGIQGRYRKNRSFSESNFGGTFTFSTLESYVAGRPLNYRETQGNPLLEVDQLEGSIFFQNDWKVTPRLTLMLGSRYEVQSNVSDYNNIAPRFGFAYALGRATVIRGGGGLFFLRLDMSAFENQRRLDGQRQFELVIDNPSFPDPFQAGTIRNTPRSIRIMDRNIVLPYVNVGMVSFERTFLTNLFVSATYDYQREYHRLRPRNINAPYDAIVSAAASVIRSCSPSTPAAACIRPDSTMGNIVQLESSGNQLRHTMRLALRQRFSIFNVTANYTLQGSSVEGQPNGAGDLPSDNYNLRLDYDGSRGNCCPPQTLNGTVNARLPLGVFLTGVVSMTSQMYNITTGRDDNRDNTVNDRPAGTPRNGGDGPKVLNFNFNISKAFFFGPDPGGNGRGGARTNLNVFANMTNAFNRLQYGPPSGVMTSPNFGRSTSALDPRQIEVGMRFQF
jgi:outer membrane receptor protein involved in Fe transport